MENMNRTIKKMLAISGIMLAVLLAAFVLCYFFANHNYIQFNIPTYSSVVLEYSEAYTEPQVQAVYTGTFFKWNTKLDVTRISNIKYDKLGDYHIIYYAHKGNMAAEAVVNISIVDTTAPEIILKESDTLTELGTPYAEEGYTAIDNFDGDVTASVVSSEENGIVTYTVTDSNGNTTTTTRIIKYADAASPGITLNGDYTMYVMQGDSYNEPGYAAYDEIEGDLSDNVTVTGNVNTSRMGVYYLNYNVSDKTGNVATAERRVYVYEKQLNVGEIDPGNKIIYLTFDDGPSDNTPVLLDILDKYNVKATFFVTSQYPNYLYLIAEEARRGHSVALHTYRHEYNNIYSSEAAYYEDLATISDIVYEQTGKRAEIVRFPGGSSNSISNDYCEGIMNLLTQNITNMGFKYCDWNVSSGDASALGTDAIYENVIKGIAANNVSVVLQHDLRLQSINAVEKIIVWGLNNGYTFLPLTASSPMVHHVIDN